MVKILKQSTCTQVRLLEERFDRTVMRGTERYPHLRGTMAHSKEVGLYIFDIGPDSFERNRMSRSKSWKFEQKNHQRYVKGNDYKRGL